VVLLCKCNKGSFEWWKHDIKANSAVFRTSFGQYLDKISITGFPSEGPALLQLERRAAELSEF
jgi:hypothetical protein